MKVVRFDVNFWIFKSWYKYIKPAEEFLKGEKILKLKSVSTSFKSTV